MGMRLLVSGSTKTVYRYAADLADWLGFLVTPKNRNSMRQLVDHGLPWAADNGAYGGFSEEDFLRLVRKIRGQRGLLWLVCPDVVADAQATLDRFDAWAPRLDGIPLALAGQDGLEDLTVPWDRIACLFIGGTTRWKISAAAADLALEAKARGKLVHMGRVNSRRRMRVAQLMKCDTVDGSSPSMFAERYLRLYVSWVRQVESQAVFPEVLS